MTIIPGATLHKQHVHADSRGELVSFEQHRNLPFLPRRVFFIKADSPDVVRGGHANSCDEFIVALSGSVLIEVDNGLERGRVRLESHDRALWVRAGIVIHLREFGPGTILLVCAPALYCDTHHFDGAQPHLAVADCAA